MPFQNQSLGTEKCSMLIGLALGHMTRLWNKGKIEGLEGVEPGKGDTEEATNKGSINMPLNMD